MPTRWVRFLGHDEQGQAVFQDLDYPSDAPQVWGIKDPDDPATWNCPTVFRMSPAMARWHYGENYRERGNDPESVELRQRLLREAAQMREAAAERARQERLAPLVLTAEEREYFKELEAEWRRLENREAQERYGNVLGWVEYDKLLRFMEQESGQRQADAGGRQAGRDDAGPARGEAGDWRAESDDDGNKLSADDEAKAAQKASGHEIKLPSGRTISRKTQEEAVEYFAKWDKPFSEWTDEQLRKERADLSREAEGIRNASPPRDPEFAEHLQRVLDEAQEGLTGIEREMVKRGMLSPEIDHERSQRKDTSLDYERSADKAKDDGKKAFVAAQSVKEAANLNTEEVWQREPDYDHRRHMGDYVDADAFVNTRTWEVARVAEGGHPDNAKDVQAYHDQDKASWMREVSDKDLVARLQETRSFLKEAIASHRDHGTPYPAEVYAASELEQRIRIAMERRGLQESLPGASRQDWVRATEFDLRRKQGYDRDVDVWRNRHTGELRSTLAGYDVTGAKVELLLVQDHGRRERVAREGGGERRLQHETEQRLERERSATKASDEGRERPVWVRAREHDKRGDGQAADAWRRWGTDEIKHVTAGYDPNRAAGKAMEYSAGEARPARELSDEALRKAGREADARVWSLDVVPEAERGAEHRARLQDALDRKAEIIREGVRRDREENARIGLKSYDDLQTYHDNRRLIDAAKENGFEVRCAESGDLTLSKGDHKIIIGGRTRDHGEPREYQYVHVTKDEARVVRPMKAFGVVRGKAERATRIERRRRGISAAHERQEQSRGREEAEGPARASSDAGLREAQREAQEQLRSLVAAMEDPRLSREAFGAAYHASVEAMARAGKAGTELQRRDQATSAKMQRAIKGATAEIKRQRGRDEGMER